MILVRAGKEERQIISGWLKARGLDYSQANDLPETGFLAYASNLAIGAGFLRRCEGGHGILDSFVTNPDAPGELRAKAMDMLIDANLEAAKELKLKVIIAFSVDKNTITRAQQHGLELQPLSVLSKRV